MQDGTIQFGSYNTSMATLSSASTGSVSLQIDGEIKTPKVITVLRGSSQEAICVESLDANTLPVTRCELLSSIGVPSQPQRLIGDGQWSDFDTLALILFLGVITNGAITLLVSARRKS